MESSTSRVLQNRQSDFPDVESLLNSTTFSEDSQMSGFKISDELKQKLRESTFRKTEAWSK